MSQPITREEKYVSAMASGNSTDIKPVTREEVFLAKATGQSVAIPEPITRKEVFLRDIALNGSGGGSVILKPFTLNEGGTYKAVDYGADGFSSVFADVDPAPLWDGDFTIVGTPEEGGGTCPSVEGTAIPVGVTVNKIYFNTNLSVEETNAYLSQLTYVDVGAGVPVHVVAHSAYGEKGVRCLLVVLKIAENDYQICMFGADLQNTDFTTYDSHAFYKSITGGWEFGFVVATDWNGVLSCIDWYANIYNDFNGIPVGADNEKIKNVLSITPFGAGGGSGGNNPTAYHLSSADDLPTDAVDGSLAVVESDSIIGEWLFNEELNIPSSDIYAEMLFTATADGEEEYYCVIEAYESENSLYYLLHDDGRNVYWEGVWEYPDARTVHIHKCEDENTKNFVRNNATRISGGHTLYSRENGEWVNKGEI